MWETKNMICYCDAHAVWMQQQTQCDVAQELNILHADSVSLTLFSSALFSKVISNLMRKHKHIVKMQSQLITMLSLLQMRKKIK